MVEYPVYLVTHICWWLAGGNVNSGKWRHSLFSQNWGYDPLSHLDEPPGIRYITLFKARICMYVYNIYIYVCYINIYVHTHIHVGK